MDVLAKQDFWSEKRQFGLILQLEVLSKQD